MQPSVAQKGGVRNVSTSVGGQVGATIQEAPHPFYRYIVARRWNFLSRNWLAIFDETDPVVGGAYDPLPSPQGLNYVAQHQPLQKKGAAAAQVKRFDVTVATTKFLAASSLGSGRC